MDKNILRAQNLSCSKGPPDQRLTAIQDFCASFQTAQVTAICGGDLRERKLLLRLLGLMEIPDRGEIEIEGQPTSALSIEERSALRNNVYGFMFGEPYLLPSFSLLENVAMPLFRISGVDTKEARSRTQDLLDFVGLRGKESLPVSEFGTMEQHLASLARALINQPKILIAEEIGLLPEESLQLWELLRLATQQFHVCVIAAAASNETLPGIRIIQIPDAPAPGMAVESEKKI